MKKETEKRILENLKEYFTVRSPLRNFLSFIIIAMCATLIKIGILASKEITQGIAFNTFVWAFIIIYLTLRMIYEVGRLEGYFLIPGILVVLWGVLNNTINLLSVAGKILVICAMVHLFILLSEILNKVEDKKCKSKKKKNKQ